MTNMGPIGSKTQTMTPKLTNVKKTRQNGLIPLQNTMYNTIQMNSVSPVNDGDKNHLIEQYYSSSK